LVFARWPEQYSQIFSVEKSTQNFEKYSSGTGFGIAKDIAQGEEIIDVSLLNKSSLIVLEPKLYYNNIIW